MKTRNLLCSVVLTCVMLGVSMPQAGALDVSNIGITYSTNRLDGAVGGYACNIYVAATGLVDAKVVNTDTATSYPLTLQPDGTYGVLLLYGDLPSFQAAHPNPTSYHFYFNELVPNVWEDQVLLGFSASTPRDYPHITYPTQGEIGVPIDPTYMWDNIDGLGAWAYGSLVREPLMDATYEDVPDFDLTKTSWQPGVLANGTGYEFLVNLYNITGGTPLGLSTLNQDAFGYYGLNAESNMVTFTTEAGGGAIPEPTSVLLVGSTVLGILGVRRRRRMS